MLVSIHSNHKIHLSPFPQEYVAYCRLILLSFRHPETAGRPSFLDISRQLSLPDSELLQWAERDKSVYPEATQLGTDLLCGEELYRDLHMSYYAPQDGSK